ncbi:MAG: hypothetical protein ACE5K7_02400 [Phycisphaerae bacterium]
MLACLAASMTVGAAGLMFLEPYTAHLYPDRAGRLGGSYLLRAEPSRAGGRWTELLIEHRADGGGRAVVEGDLADRYHFIVGADGRVRVCPAWRAQKGVAGWAGVIRIAVEAYPNSSTVSPRQWQSLLRLVRGLQQYCQVNWRRTRLASRVPAASGPLGRQSDQLRAMLQAARIIR